MEASSKEMCQKGEDMILLDRRIKVSVIAHELGISVSSIILFSLDDVKNQFPMDAVNVVS